uniref:Sulfhydryl oxidase n=1 Tax=Syphacia muris TaxID=451379 RepID=A0A0N5ARC9_9BILA
MCVRAKNLCTAPGIIFSNWILIILIKMYIKKAFIIEFYSSWCGACIAYAPHFKTFASRVKNWSPILQVAAVNCGEDINSKLCREHGIEAFPTLKFFKYSSQSKDDGSFFRGDTHDIINLPLELASLIQQQWSKEQPSGWPNFDFIDDSTSLNQMWQQSGSASLLVVIIGSLPAKLSWAVSHLIFFYFGVIFSICLSVFILLITFTLKVQMIDIMSAMHHMLQEEIPRKQHIAGERLEALKMWIRMLKMYAPGTTPIRRLFFRLDKWLQSQNNGITSEQWTEEVNTVQAELGHPLPANMTWKACRGSKPYLRGYTCGLWTLMHFSTSYNLKYKALKFNIVEPIHQFIWRFLSCEICGKHFHTYYTKTNLKALKKPEDGIMWLWKAHNIANEVLAKQPSDDPAFPKQQFPPKSLCSSCWSDDKFVENEVVTFLTKYYSDIRSDELQVFVQESPKRLNPKFAIGFENVDKIEQIEDRQRRQLDVSPQRRWKNIDNRRSYDPSSGIQTFYLLWIAIGIVAVVIVYMQYSRNRSKFWKTFYYYNDYKL